MRLRVTGPIRPFASRFGSERAIMSGMGHNGGPSLDSERPAIDGKCRLCRHWCAPSESWESKYRLFKMTGKGRRVKRPSGTCDRVLIGGKVSFSATNGDYRCGNFEAKPQEAPKRGGAFVTIWKGNRIIWQGPEEDQPPEQLDLLPA